MVQDLSYIGKGMIYLEDRAAGNGLFPIGNCSALRFEIEREEKSLLDYKKAGGGKANQLSRITDVRMTIEARDLSADNIAMALYGKKSAITTTPVTGESHTAYPDALVKLNSIPDTSKTITVKDSGGTTTYLEGTDYEVTRAGIIILSGGSIGSGSTIEVDYTPVAGNVIEALVNSGKEYRLVFDGLNEAQGEKALVVTVHRVKFAPTSGLDLIGDDFATLELAGDVLADTSITGSDISQYIKVEQAS